MEPKMPGSSEKGAEVPSSNGFEKPEELLSFLYEKIETKAFDSILPHLDTIFSKEFLSWLKQLEDGSWAYSGIFRRIGDSFSKRCVEMSEETEMDALKQECSVFLEAFLGRYFSADLNISLAEKFDIFSESGLAHYKLFDLQPVLDQLLQESEDGGCGYVIDNIRLFHLSEAEQVELATRIIKEKNRETVQKLVTSRLWEGDRHEGRFPLSAGVAQALMDAGYKDILLVRLSWGIDEDEFTLSSDAVQQLINAFFLPVDWSLGIEDHVHFSDQRRESAWSLLRKLNAESGGDDTLQYLYELYVNSASPELYLQVKELGKTERLDWVEAVLDSDDTSQGVERLQHGVVGFKEKLLNGNFSVADMNHLQTHGLERAVFEKVLDPDTFLTIINKYDREVVIRLLIGRGWVGGSFNCLTSYHSMNEKVYEALYEAGYAEELLVMLSWDTLPISPHIVKKLFESFFQKNDWTLGVPGLEKFGGDPQKCWENFNAVNRNMEFNQTLSGLLGLFGEEVSPEDYTRVKGLGDTHTIDWVEKYIEPNDNSEGFLRLEHAVANLTHSILNEGFPDADAVLNDSWLKIIVKKIIRYELAEYGEKDDASFEKTIRTYVDLEHEGKIRPLSEEIVEGTLAPKKVRTEKVRYGKNFTAAYTEFIETVRDPQIKTERRQKLSDLAEIIASTVLPNMRTFLENLKEEEANPKRIEYLENLISTLEESKFRGRNSLEETFVLLANVREEVVGAELKTSLNRLLTQLVVQTHIERDLLNMEEGFLPEDIENPTREELSKLIDYVGHSLQQEFLEKRGYLKTKAGFKAFRSLFKISVLEEQLANWHVEVSDAVTPTKVLPSRDLLTEFSGHTSDSCWAGTYPSICQFFPNIASYTLVQNPENKNVRIAGSFLTIDTVDTTTNEPVMVIRGLNPIQNYINQVDPESFLNELTTYLRPIAEKRGMKLAIVIDDHSGGSSTNRPVLYNYLTTLRSTLIRCTIPDTLALGERKEIYIDGDPDPLYEDIDDDEFSRRELQESIKLATEDFGQPTNFNGYDISEDTYYL